MNPPNSDPNSFPSPFDPIPPSPGYGGGPSSGSTGGPPGGTSGGSPRPGQISLDAISDAWRLLQPNMGPWIGATLIYLVVVGIFQGMQFVTQSHVPGQPARQNGASIGLSIISSIVSVILYGGMFNMALHTVRTGKADIAEMFNIADVVLNMLIGAFLTFIAYFVGILLCCIPGIYVGVALALTQLIIIDRKMGAIEAMTLSWETVKPQWGAMFGFMIVSGLLAGVGFLACGVGILVTIPLVVIAYAVVYRDLFLGGNNFSAPITYPNAPIADPNG